MQKSQINVEKKILLISANQHKVPYPVYPLGLAYISSYLKENSPEYEIRIFDFNLNDLSDFKKELEEFAPRYVGISLRNADSANSLNPSNFIEDYSPLVELVKEYGKSITVVGGAGYSIFPKLIYELLSPDFGIYGEGEVSFRDLIETIDQGQFNFNDIDGLIYRTNGQVALNKKKRFGEGIKLQYDESAIEYYWQQSGTLNIQTKRGCPYQCVYCSYPLIEGSQVRTLDADKIVDSLAHLYHEKNINYVFFTDRCLT